MSSSRFSQSPYPLLASSLFATIFLGFGINAILRPRHALAVFEFELPRDPAEQALVESLLILYGARDLFMGLAIYAATYFGSRRALGWILIAASGVAVVDGAVCRAQIGRGEWNHWGYAPALTTVGSVLVGAFDWV